ncbi:MAG: DUF362 domain-containing protein [Kiritimatiellales bacterium]|nr:DUF362 domain-containing protein [Kiritimatiellales bacterium]
MSVTEVDFVSYESSAPQVLDAAGARELFAKQQRVLINPNLVNKMGFPITTPAVCCAVLIDYIRECSDAEIVLGEGNGEMGCETDEVFAALGYTEMAKEKGVELIDLNHAPLRKVENSRCPLFPEMYLPEIAFTYFIISVPVLKAHCFSDVTGAMKNMMGFLPPKHYSGRFGSWKKAMFHREMHESIVELNRHCTPDFCLMDATVGMAEFHLGGPECDPPIGKLLAGTDAQEIDRRGAELLGFDWQSIKHLATEL